MITFGRALRPLWGLGDGVFLNHGSFGACPLEIIRAQEELRAEMERQPDAFFRDRVVPRAGGTPLRAAAKVLAAFVGADELAFVENATSGIQAVLNGFALGPGDMVLITNHTYNAIRLMAEARCAASGARVRVVEIPLDANHAEVVAAFRDALSPQVKLAIIDHITSPTALLLPQADIINLLRRNGTRVLVDGAHAVGQIPLDLAALEPDWYVSNAHKWLYAPRGTAFLYAAPGVRAATQPHIVSHFVGLGFPQSFDYIGTRDYTAWLTMPTVLGFFEKLGPEALWDYQRALIARAAALLADIGVQPVNAHSAPAMRAFILPQRRPMLEEDASQLMHALWRDAHIQVAAMTLAGKLLLRLSAQAYVDADDFAHLQAALARHGWPGR